MVPSGNPVWRAMEPCGTSFQTERGQWSYMLRGFPTPRRVMRRAAEGLIQMLEQGFVIAPHLGTSDGDLPPNLYKSLARCSRQRRVYLSSNPVPTVRDL